MGTEPPTPGQSVKFTRISIHSKEAVIQALFVATLSEQIRVAIGENGGGRKGWRRNSTRRREGMKRVLLLTLARVTQNPRRR